jgi:thiol-disulfide isomerase/thioredoxin
MPMPALALIVRLVLAGVFLVAGGAKLIDLKGTRKAVVAFGVPERAAGALAIALPLAELFIAGLLMPASTARYGSLGVLVLLAIIGAAILSNLARGRAPECHCFGQLHSAPVSWRTLARNAVLVAVAAFALAESLRERDRSAVAWLGRLDGAEAVALGLGLAAAVLVAAGGAAFVWLLRSYGRVLVRLERVERALADAGIDVAEPVELPEIGLAPGTPAPEHAELAALLERGLPVLLLFTSPRCGPCRALLPSAAAWQAEQRDALTVAFASDGAEDEVFAEAAALELDHVFVDHDLALYEALGANGTPSAVLIAADGTIGSWLASGADEIERLLTGALEEEPGLTIGSEVPELELPSLDGELVPLAELGDRDTLLLFWNPGCGFCRAMHEELLAWERSENGRDPRLVVVSSGDPESTRADGFRSQVLLDRNFAAGALFGANGTPMAVLLDAEGRVGSQVVAGAEAVLELARNGNGHDNGRPS